MRESISQLPLFLACIWCGFALGALYELLRLVRRLGGRFLAAVCDLVFGASAALLTEGALLATDMGRLRLYSLPLIAAAFFLWQRLAGRPLRRIAARIRSGLNRSNGKRQ